MKYNELKNQHSTELNSFEGVFFAFNNEQFAEGIKKIGLAPDDTSKIYSIGSGGYILKTRSQAFSEMFRRHEMEMKELKKDQKNLLDALVYELNNHEYNYTGDIEPALDALGLKEDEIDPTILKKARTIASREVF